MSETNTITNSKKISACYIIHCDNNEMMLMSVPGSIGYKIYDKRGDYITIYEKNSDIPTIVRLAGDEMSMTDEEVIELAAITGLRHLEVLSVSKIDKPNEEA